MKEIKHRGREVETGKWIYGNYVYNNGDFIFSNNKFHEVRRDTVGQLTGQIDSNGEDIYEGDKLKVGAEECYSNDNFTTDYDWEMVMGVVYVYGAFELQSVEDKYISIYFCETEDMKLALIRGE